MLRHARERLVDQPVSLEAEKIREGIDALFPLADILLFSRAFVSGRGFDSATAFFDAISGQAPGGMLICTWGEQGAYARDRHQRDYHSPAFPPVSPGRNPAIRRKAIRACTLR